MRWMLSAIVAAVVVFACGLFLHAEQDAAPGSAAPAAAPGSEAAAPAAPAAPAEVTDEQVSYAMGVLVGKDFKPTGMKLDTAQFAKGYAEVAGHDETWEGLVAAQKTLQQYAMQLHAKQTKKNVEEGKQFLADNAKKEGVKTTASGLQYQVLTEGTGTQPKASDTVTVQYEGKLLNGTVFDSSYKRGQPATFQLDRVIPGWTEGVQLMKEGGKTRLFIPSELAYGEQGTPGGPIPPHATLIFDVELVKIAPAKTEEAPAPAPATESGSGTQTESGK